MKLETFMREQMNAKEYDAAMFEAAEIVDGLCIWRKGESAEGYAQEKATFFARALMESARRAEQDMITHALTVTMLSRMYQESTAKMQQHLHDTEKALRYANERIIALEHEQHDNAYKIARDLRPTCEAGRLSIYDAAINAYIAGAEKANADADADAKEKSGGIAE